MMSISYCHESKLKHYLSLIHCPYSVLTNRQIDIEADVLRVDGPVIDALIIDSLVVYYGGINPFIYGQKEGTIMRFEDKDLAKQVRDLLLKIS